MISIEKRQEQFEEVLNKYEIEIQKSINSCLKSDFITKQVDLEYYKKQLEKLSNIRKIIDRMGFKDYNALNSMASLNWFVANYTRISKADFDKYVKIFGIEEKDRIYDTIVFETQQLVVKNLIWKECLEMDYDLISIKEATDLYNKISDLPLVEKHKKELEVLCKSGYFNRKYRNPFDIASIDEVCQTLEKIRKNNKKNKTLI